LQVRCELEGDRLGQRDVPHLPALGRSEDLTTAEQLDLPADMHDPAQEVDVVHRKPEDLALPQPTARGQRGHHPIPGRQALPDSRDLFRRPGHDPPGRRGWRLDRRRPARIADDPLVVDGSGQDRRQVGEDDADVAGREGLLEAAEPRLDLGRPQR
jgi:hypothetical protein